MVREVVKEDLDSLLELYLFLHEDSIPEHDKHLEETWEQILEDPNHHLIVNEIDGQIVSSCVCVIIPNLTRSVRPYAFVEKIGMDKLFMGSILQTTLNTRVLPTGNFRYVRSDYPGKLTDNERCMRDYGHEPGRIVQSFFRY